MNVKAFILFFQKFHKDLSIKTAKKNYFTIFLRERDCAQLLNS